MAKIAYKKYRPQNSTTRILGFSNSIIEEFQADGFDVTLRQLYYQIIARDLFPDEWKDDEGNKNNPKSYSKFKAVIGNGRLGGLVDWDSIVDRTRRKICWKESLIDEPAGRMLMWVSCEISVSFLEGGWGLRPQPWGVRPQ